MKQLLSLFLFLLPCFAWAQYPSNGNQKITLGEQTTADGLIYRGVASTDTVRKPSIDTMAYMVLDTTTNIIWHYKKATNNAWLRLNLLPSDTASIAYVNTYETQTVNGTKTFTTAPTFGNALGLASGGTGGTSYASGNVIYSNGTALTSDTSLFWDSTNKILSIGKKTILSTNADLQVGGKGNRARVFILAPNANDYTQMIFGHGTASNGQYAEFIRNNTNKEFDITNVDGDFFVSTKVVSSALRNDFFLESDNGRIGLGTNAPSQALHVVGNARITAMNGIAAIGADANGVLQAATSDMNLKNTIENIPFGLNEILLLNPVTFLYNDINRKIDSDVKEVGFIAQDVFDIIPNAVSSTGTGDLQLDYRAITATLVKAIQEQQALIKALEQRIINLQNK
jgi:hypothetical protein